MRHTRCLSGTESMRQLGQLSERCHYRFHRAHSLAGRSRTAASRLGRVPWLGVHARPADGWAGRRFSQRHRHLPLYDFMFDHFRGVVVSDLLTVKAFER